MPYVTELFVSVVYTLSFTRESIGMLAALPYREIAESTLRTCSFKALIMLDILLLFSLTFLNMIKEYENLIDFTLPARYNL